MGRGQRACCVARSRQQRSGPHPPSPNTRAHPLALSPTIHPPPLPVPQGALALTYKEQYKSPFLPVMPGHVLAEYNNLESAAAVIKKGRTAAVFVEPVQVRPRVVSGRRGALGGGADHD